LSYLLSSSPDINKLCFVPATSDITFPWSIAAECIALGTQTIHNMRWSQLLVQNCDFCLPHLHLVPLLGVYPSEYCHNVWYRKTRMLWLPDGEKILKISYSYVTDRWTCHNGIGKNGFCSVVMSFCTNSGCRLH